MFCSALYAKCPNYLVFYMQSVLSALYAKYPAGAPTAAWAVAIGAALSHFRVKCVPEHIRALQRS